MWPLIGFGLLYTTYLVASGEWRSLLFGPKDMPGAVAMAKYYLRLRKDHPPQGKHNPLQKLAYTSVVLLGALAVLSGVAIYKPLQFAWLTALFGGFQLARYWHFWTVWLFVGFSIVHVVLVFVVDPSSLRAMITGWYRGRFPSHG
jgi:thiosulfate reductase cytochrome b subunit